MSLSTLSRLPEPAAGPEDRHVFVVCTGEACADRGAGELLHALRAQCRHSRGEVRVGAAKCMGHCQLAPAVIEDGRMLGHVSGQRLRAELYRLGVLEEESLP